MAIRLTGNHQNTPRSTSTAMAPRTTTLSASGSRKAPDLVVPWRRASHPSTPSVHDSRNQNVTVDHDAPWVAIMAISTGKASTRVSVMALAGVSRADGPNASAAVVRL